MHGTLFENQKALEETSFEQWAVAAGVDGAKFTEAFKAGAGKAKVDEDMALAQKVGAGGTPSFRINGKVLSGAQPFDKFKEAIDAELKAADELVKSGTKPSEVSLALTKKNYEAPKAQGQGAGGKPSAPAEDSKAVIKVTIAPDDPVRGPKDAPVTVVMFSDFQCPFCARVEPTLKQVEDTYKDDVRIVWKDNALPFHNRAKQAANFARAAYAKGGDKLFWKAHDELFANQKDLEDSGLEAVAKTIGLDWTTAKAAIDGNKYGDKISASINQADEVDARGTPHFFVNGRRLSGAKPFDAFKALIDEELGKAKALIKNGVPADKVYDEIMKTAKSGSEPDVREVPAPTKADPVRGSASAQVTINVFSDFQCPFCSRVEPTLKQLLDEYGSKVRFVWRDMPLPFHQKAPLASEAAYEVFVQKGNDGFWAYHDKLFANQQAIDRPDLEKYAQEMGVDMAKFKDALDSHKHKAHVDANIEVAKKAGVSGTPAFTINGIFLSGAQPYEKFDKTMKLALAGK
jgi:protein-disulfide isomerase